MRVVLGQLCCMVLRHGQNDSRMLRYMARVRWQDMISSKEVAKICGLKMIQDKLRQQRLQRSCEKGNRGRSAEISGRNGSIREKESRKTKENLERCSEEGFGTNRSG